MKVYRTIKTFKEAYEILGKLKLDGLMRELLSDVKDGLGSINFEELIKVIPGALQTLLVEGQAVAFFQAITKAEKYQPEPGEAIAWDDVDVEILVPMVKDFFGLTGGTWTKLTQLSKKAETAEAESPAEIPLHV